MKLAEYLRPRPGARLPKRVRPALCSRWVHRPDSGYPSARIARLRARRPGFVSNREGWARFHRWQNAVGERLQLTQRLLTGSRT